jgi:hypothetical protein
MHSPGIEPGTSAWKADILPLNYECCEGRGWLSKSKKANPEIGVVERKEGILLSSQVLPFSLLLNSEERREAEKKTWRESK